MANNTASSSSSSSSPSETPPAASPPAAASPPMADEQRVTLRSPAELVDALPYLVGFHPDDSVVIVALHGPGSRFGGRLRQGIPERPEAWPGVADQLADHLVRGSERRTGKPDGAIVFLCRDPGPGEGGRAVMERLRPLAQRLRTACGALDVPVYEALCVSGGRWWSYVCPDPECCPPDGVPVRPPGTSVMAAAAAFAGIRVRGSLKEIAARFDPRAGAVAQAQEEAFDEAAADLVGRILDHDAAKEVRRETADLLASAMERFRRAPVSPEGTRAGPGDLSAEARREADADRKDDALLGADEAARIILGLQDRQARDRAAEWMELPDAGAALRLWRALARRCVGAFQDHSAPPLTLAGWVAWSSGDEAEARVAFHRALSVDPDYTFAQLLHHACNGGLDPEPLRDCLRGERNQRERGSSRGSDGGSGGGSGAGS